MPLKSPSLAVAIRRAVLAGGVLAALALVGPAAAQAPDDVMQELMEEQQRILRELQGILGNPGGFPPGGPALRSFPGPNNAAYREPRLGVGVSRPGQTLVEQLDLPGGQGLTLDEVRPGSAAARAGMKPHDILLELDGKPVPNDPGEFGRQLAAIPAEKEVGALVLRRGKRELLKGLKLPAAREARPGVRFGVNDLGVMPQLPGGFGALGGVVPGVRGFGFDLNPPGAGGGGVTTIFRSGDRFTARYQDGDLTVTVTGKVERGKAAVGEIQVQAGRETHQYDALDKLPEAYRDRAKRLVQQAEKGTVPIPSKDFDHEI